ncbi:ester cyclase [Gandjariella thermophila]|uniref:Ester cyclase n=1 Tax=Gandjariella thermophila TaxID=1931992 RepID=A0A4D4J581_9PSEU|nr:ester cyclase [Gandjariella thermophila]GDY29123.1 hypothetical protein GTS_07560 [Gandjariella thermophila]
MEPSERERIAAQRRTIDEHIAGENAHDWSRVYGTFVQDDRAYYDVVPLSSHFGGFSGVKDFYGLMEGVLPDFRIVVTGEYDTPRVSVREVTISGTHRGEYCGVAPQGRHVSFELAAFYIFGEGEDAARLVAERIYFDNETLLRQMRGEPDAPVGVGLAAHAVGGSGAG